MASPRLTAWERAMVFYMRAHRHPVNVGIHLVFVPVILQGALIVAAQAGIPGTPYHLAWAIAGFSWANWDRLDATIARILLPIVLLMSYVAHRTLALEPRDALLLGGGLFVGGYLMQFLGHAIEGRKPSLTENPLAAMMTAPMFVVAEVGHKFGARLDELQRVNEALARVDAGLPAEPEDEWSFDDEPTSEA